MGADNISYMQNKLAKLTAEFKKKEENLFYRNRVKWGRIDMRLASLGD